MHGPQHLSCNRFLPLPKCALNLFKVALTKGDQPNGWSPANPFNQESACTASSTVALDPVTEVLHVQHQVKLLYWEARHSLSCIRPVLPTLICTEVLVCGAVCPAPQHRCWLCFGQSSQLGVLQITEQRPSSRSEDRFQAPSLHDRGAPSNLRR